MSFRTLASLLLVGTGIGLPWLVQDWLDAPESPGIGERLQTRWQERFSKKGEDAAGPTERAAESEPGKSLEEGREPYAFAQQTRRILQGFLGTAGFEPHRQSPASTGSGNLPSTPKSHVLVEGALQRLSSQMAGSGLRPGDTVALRIFKEEGELEIWMKPESEPLHRLFKIHRLSHRAGLPGPKLREGDGQAPEGFYALTGGAMRPETKNHLGIDLGFPNEYDQYQGWSGSNLMIHGGGREAGGFALAPEAMEEVYALVEEALKAGQGEVSVLIFPFRMSDSRMDSVLESRPRWEDFWIVLKEGHDFFENVRLPPEVSIEDGRYHFKIAAGEN